MTNSGFIKRDYENSYLYRFKYFGLNVQTANTMASMFKVHYVYRANCKNVNMDKRIQAL